MALVEGGRVGWGMGRGRGWGGDGAGVGKGDGEVKTLVKDLNQKRGWGDW